VRRQLVKRIGAGETAVWLLLESGDRRKDDEAARLLESRLKQLTTTLKLPELTDAPEDRVTPDGPPLRIAFSVIRLSRTDAAEQLLVSMLLHSEEDLMDSKEPMAFPVFGRGRALWALIGKGINDDTIEEAGAFLVGPCSCQVKRLNPGTDLLIAADWDGLLGDRRVVKDPVPPPLRGLDIFLQAGRRPTPATSPVPARLDDPDPPPSEPAELLPIPPRCLEPAYPTLQPMMNPEEAVLPVVADPPPVADSSPALLRNIGLAVLAGMLAVAGLAILLWTRTAR
jgi:hypothetical protein